MKTKKIDCNLCGSANYNVVYEKAKVKAAKRPKDEYLISEESIEKPDRILKCNNCGLIYAEPKKDLKYYDDKYAEMVDEGYVEEEIGRRKASVRILKRIERYKRSGRLLDVGCASGFRSEEHSLNSSHIPLSRMPSSA